MPNMNGFQLCEKLLELDVNIRVCFMSALELNIQALRLNMRKASYLSTSVNTSLIFIQR